MICFLTLSDLCNVTYMKALLLLNLSWIGTWFFITVSCYFNENTLINKNKKSRVVQFYSLTFDDVTTQHDVKK